MRYVRPTKQELEEKLQHLYMKLGKYPLVASVIAEEIERTSELIREYEDYGDD